MAKFKISKPVKKPVTKLAAFRLPLQLLTRLKRASKRNGITSTALLIEALEHALKHLES